MYPQIYLDGPGADSPGAGRAVLELHRRMLSRFAGQKALDEAYVETLRMAKNDSQFIGKDRPLTRFELAFQELAAQVHLQHRLPARAEFFFETMA